MRYALATPVLACALALSVPAAATSRAEEGRPSKAAMHPPVPGQVVDARQLRPIGDEVYLVTPQEHSIVTDRRDRTSSSLRAGSATAPPPSPGLSMGVTAYDYQHNESQGYQAARAPGRDEVHFCWAYMSIDWNDRYVNYQSYDTRTGTFSFPYGGVPVSLNPQARGGYGNVDVQNGVLVRVFLHQKLDPTLPFMSWVISLDPYNGNLVGDELPTDSLFPELIWPHGGVQNGHGDNGADVVHVVSHGANADPQDRIVYWRYDGLYWQGPVRIDSNAILGYVVATDANSSHCAIFLHSDRPTDGFNGLRNIAYYESNTAGAGFISGAELGAANKHFVTNYSDPSGPEAWVHISAAYDHAGALHVIWDEQRQAKATAQVAIRH